MKIPAGVEDGTALRVPGRGMPSGGPGPGDLFVVIQAAPDPRFERRARISGVPRSIENRRWCAAQPRSANATVKVPPGTQPGTVLRCKGKGLPNFGGHGCGAFCTIERSRSSASLARNENSTSVCEPSTVKTGTKAHGDQLMNGKNGDPCSRTPRRCLSAVKAVHAQLLSAFTFSATLRIIITVKPRKAPSVDRSARLCSRCGSGFSSSITT